MLLAIPLGHARDTSNMLLRKRLKLPVVGLSVHGIAARASLNLGLVTHVALQPLTGVLNVSGERGWSQPQVTGQLVRTRSPVSELWSHHSIILAHVGTTHCPAWHRGRDIGHPPHAEEFTESPTAMRFRFTEAPPPFRSIAAPPPTVSRPGTASNAAAIGAGSDIPSLHLGFMRAPASSMVVRVNSKTLPAPP